ncbi:MAG: PIG-L deacetylase family protein [Thermomicrobiales bacterium]
MSGTEHTPDYGVTNGGPVMAIFAHADDPEFVAGGALALWAAAGRRLIYVICTDGSKGSSDPDIAPADLIARRQEEQRAAARAFGCEDVVFLGYEDAMLEPTLDLRRDITREIRRYQPEIAVAFDPSVYWFGDSYIQHPDHRASGEAALAAIFPAARDHLTFPELLAEGFAPHKVEEVYLASSDTPNRWFDISSVLDRKIAAIRAHQSQVGDGAGAFDWVRERAHAAGKEQGLEYAESYRFINLAARRSPAERKVEE